MARKVPTRSPTHEEVDLTRLAVHDRVRVELHDRAFLLQRPLDLPADTPVARDPSLALAAAFRDACVALDAEVGAVLTLPQHHAPGWLADLYHDVLGCDGDALVRAAAGLLYLDDRLARGVRVPANRDRLPTPRGLAVFAGHGARRWF